MFEKCRLIYGTLYNDTECFQMVYDIKDLDDLIFKFKEELYTTTKYKFIRFEVGTLKEEPYRIYVYNTNTEITNLLLCIQNQYSDLL